MTTPIDRMIDAACLTCTCCGEAQVEGCACWKDYIDHCHFRCVLHCKRPECKRRRKNGLWRINWAGTRHIYFNGDERTLCGRRMPTTGYALRVPTVGLRGGECTRCASGLQKMATAPPPA